MEKENKSAVDERDNKIMELCKRAISQAQDIVLSDKEHKNSERVDLIILNGIK